MFTCCLRDPGYDTLKRENKALQKKLKEWETSNFECKICFDRVISDVLLPCGHALTCEKCTALCVVAESCPVCKRAVTHSQRIFLQ